MSGCRQATSRIYATLRRFTVSHCCNSGSDAESTDDVVRALYAARHGERKSLVFAAKTCQDFIGFNPVVTVRRRDRLLYTSVSLRYALNEIYPRGRRAAPNVKMSARASTRGTLSPASGLFTVSG